MTSLVAQTVKRLSTLWETWVQSVGGEDPLEKEMAIHSSTIAQKIPWTEATVQGRRKESDTTERLHFSLSFMVKTLQKVGTERTYLKTLKAIYKKDQHYTKLTSY